MLKKYVGGYWNVAATPSLQDSLGTFTITPKRGAREPPSTGPSELARRLIPDQYELATRFQNYARTPENKSPIEL